MLKNIWVLSNFVFFITMRALAVRTFKCEVVIIKTDEIGDFFIWLNTLGVYSFNTQPVLVTSSLNAAIARETGIFKDVIEINKPVKFDRSVWRYLRSLTRISALDANTVISCVQSRHPVFNDCIVLLIKAKSKIGVKCDLQNQSRFFAKITNRFYSKLWSSPFEVFVHEIHKNNAYFEFLRHEGYVFKPMRQRKFLADRLSTDSPLPNNYILIAPGARKAYRRYPIDNFITLAKFLSEASIPQIVVGAGAEKAYNSRIKDALQTDMIIDKTGSTTILELVDLIKNSQLVITNESSAAHIAAYFNVRHVVFLGGGHLDRFFPYPPAHLPVKTSFVVRANKGCDRCNWNCVHVDLDIRVPPCITDIGVDSTQSLVNSILRDQT